jgi:TRAP-type C4-dicarboxylate transport system permease small subunit
MGRGERIVLIISSILALGFVALMAVAGWNAAGVWGTAGVAGFLVADA